MPVLFSYGKSVRITRALPSPLHWLSSVVQEITVNLVSAMYEFLISQSNVRIYVLSGFLIQSLPGFKPGAGQDCVLIGARIFETPLFAGKNSVPCSCCAGVPLFY